MPFTVLQCVNKDIIINIFNKHNNNMLNKHNNMFMKT